MGMSFYFVNLSNFMGLVAKKMQEKKRKSIIFFYFFGESLVGKKMKNTCSDFHVLPKTKKIKNNLTIFFSFLFQIKKEEG